MIGYVTIGTNDLDRSAKFFDALLAQIDGKRFMETDQFIAWHRTESQPGFAVTKPFDGQSASVGNGTMVAIAVETPAMVDALYARAIELGASCEGPAGPRGDGFYAGYFRDLDGNKFNAFCLTS